MKPMTPSIPELQLSQAIARADHIRDTMSAADPRDWHRYLAALRSVSLANWSATTDIQMKFALVRSALNEVR
ncbi:hypothetical protein WKR88_18045 [Trinickia caryophylli]|nr:hypothetical protein [Trinickia caryophylli]WQE11424.1 hypothetical protein U0034_16985 [Trinickia caryophylli]